MKEKSSFAEVLVSILIFIAVLYIIGSIGNKKESDTASYSRSRYSSSYSTKSTTGSGSSYNSSTKKNTTGTSSIAHDMRSQTMYDMRNLKIVTFDRLEENVRKLANNHSW